MMKWVAGCSGLVLGAVAIGACYGTIDGDEAPAVVQDRAALVSKKRKWLERFDRHCDACYAAFDLCQLGAEPDEVDACAVAMDACVRGGLLGEDAGVDLGEDDAGAVDEEDAAIDEDDDDARDEGADASMAEPDASFDDDDADDEEQGRDGDAGLDLPDDDDEEGDETLDAGLDGGVGDPSDGDDGDDDAFDDRERAKEVLIGEIGECLELARTCLEPQGADAATCVRGLQQCVQQALEEAFDVVCTEQVRACRDEKQSRANVERVERECRAALLI